jgi:hypothetical protein
MYSFKGVRQDDDTAVMRRYNIYASMPMAGRYELMKENQHSCGRSDEDYWNECFTWEDLKKIIPYLRSQGWKFEIEPISENQSCGKIHIYSFTYGVNHEFRMINASGLRVIMARDFGIDKTRKEYSNPLGY